MTEKLEVRIFINGAHKLGKDKYVQGRIHGIMSAISEVYYEGILPGVHRDDEGVRMKTICTKEEYAKFKERIENDYKGLCQFIVTEIEE